jgi:hypothetical protein
MLTSLLNPALLAAALALQVPPAVAPNVTPTVTPAGQAAVQAAPKPVPAGLPVDGKADAKAIAFVTQAANAALANDIALMARLDTPFPKPVTFKDANASDVLESVRTLAKVSVEIDTRAVGDAGGWEYKHVTCAPATARAALDAVIRAISPDYQPFVADVAAGIVVITDPSGQRTLRARAQYPLGGTLARLGGKTEGDEATLSAKEQLERFVELTQPDVWNSQGGDIGAIQWTGEVATITATPAMHHDIRRRLAELEELLPAASLQWTVRAVEFDAKATKDAIDAAIGSAGGIDAVVKDGLGKLLSAPKIMAPTQQPAEIKVGDGASSIEVHIDPIAGDAGAVFAVRAKQTDGQRTREIAMRAVPGVRSVGVIDAGGTRLLVEVLGMSESALKALKRATATK